MVLIRDYFTKGKSGKGFREGAGETGFWIMGRGTTKAHLPVVEQEEAAWQGDSKLKPPPVRDGISDGDKDQEPNREGHLVEDAHCSPVLRTNDFCHCKHMQKQVNDGSATAAQHSGNSLCGSAGRPMLY